LLALIIIASLLAAFVLLLCIPMDVTFAWESGRTPAGRFRFAWFFGAVGWDARKAAKVREKRTVSKKRGLSRTLDGIGDFIAIIRIRGLWKKVTRLMRDFFRRVEIKKLSGDISLGLGNPAETGILLASIYALRPLLGGFAGGLLFHPIFGQPLLEARVEGTFRLQPIRMAVPLARFIFSGPVARLARTMASRRWKRRRN